MTRHPAPQTLAANEPILQFFAWSHLPAHLQAVSKPFGELAHQIVDVLPRNPERTVALRKLLESKDAAVRAALFVDGEVVGGKVPDPLPVVEERLCEDLERLGETVPEEGAAAAFDELRDRAKHPSARVRVGAVCGLGALARRFSAWRPSVLSALTEAKSQDADRGVRWAATETLDSLEDLR